MVHREVDPCFHHRLKARSRAGTAHHAAAHILPERRAIGFKASMMEKNNT
jgi:hypothetical protein